MYLRSDQYARQVVCVRTLKASLEDLQSAATEFIKSNGDGGAKAIVDGIKDIVKAYQDAGGKDDENAIKDVMNKASAAAVDGEEK